MKTVVIDVSHHQKQIDWKKIKESGSIRYREIFTGFIADTENHYFDLPYATHALVAKPYRYADLKLVNVEKTLNVVIQGFANHKNYITKKTYYRPEDVYDARYEPNFSPLIMCGSEVGFKLSGSKDITLRIYVKDRDDNYYYGDYFLCRSGIPWT